MIRPQFAYLLKHVYKPYVALRNIETRKSSLLDMARERRAK